MAILVPRKRVIETFVNKDLAKASRKMVNNTDAYRALKGRFTPKVTRVNDWKTEEICRKYLELME